MGREEQISTGMRAYGINEIMQEDVQIRSPSSNSAYGREDIL
jgi:hypothetical protein